MMKSFFKKLAFVMALAMVVTLAAPAAQASAATALGIALQSAKSKEEVVTESSIEVGETVDYKYYFAPKNYKELNPTWESSNPDVATVDKLGNVTGVKDGVAVIAIKLDNGQIGTMKVTVGKGEVAEITAAQKTASSVEVTFAEARKFDATGASADGENTVKVYRVFTSDEMAQMSNKNGLIFDEEGNGYQAYYVKNTWNSKFDGNENTVWTIEGYNVFVDGATYAVVFGPNETSSTINGIKTTFTAYVGKPAYIEISGTNATVENDVEPAIAAVLTTKLFNAQNIDITDYWTKRTSDETDFELVNSNVDVSVSGNEVTFDEPGFADIKGTYTFYDEEKEEDTILDDTTTIFGTNYNSYRVERIYNWTLASGYKAKWSATTTEMIAGDSDKLYVIVVDNRGNYYSNVPGIEKENYYINGKQVLEIGDDNENTAFEQYQYELVFDSLDPDSLLVDADGVVETYKKTNSFAVVSYKHREDGAALREIGIMGIKVKAARKLDSVKYNATSFTVLAETESEDGRANAYENYPDFNLSDDLTVEFLNQYGKPWGENAEDWGDVRTNFTVTTTKDDFVNVAADMADDLNNSQKYVINAAMFEGTNTSSVSFKIKENATGDSTTITVKLDKPKYVTDANGEATDEVFVDPTRAILDTADINMYLTGNTTSKLFQVSKSNQKVGYFRVGDLELGDENHSYYVANDVTNNFVVKAGEELDFVTTTASGSAIASGSSLKMGDYVLVVTDPSGKVFPAVGKGGNGKSFGTDSLLGIAPTGDGTAFGITFAAVKANGEMEYAANGTYRATVYKITNIVDNKNTNGVVISTKYNTSRVASDSFVIQKTLSNASFFHQENTKNVAVSEFTENNNTAIKQAISETMTFRMNGEDFNVDANGEGKYKSNVEYWGLTEYDNANEAYWGYHYLKIEIDSVDYKVQADGSRAVINTVTFKVWTPAGGYYLTKVKVNRSVNAGE